MKVVKYLILIILIFTIFTSGSFGIISRYVDNTVIAFKSLYSKVENLVVEERQITEILYEEYYETMPQFDACYNSLNSNQKEIYKRIYAISQKMPVGFVKLYNKYDGVNNDITIAYNAFLYDCTEVFWMPYTYILADYSNSDGDFIAVAFSQNGENRKTDYNVTKEQRDKMQKKFDAEVNRIVSLAKKLKNDFEIEKFFNDYICENTEYVTDGFLVSTAYGALMEKKAHCEGYSRAFKHLCNKMGIECDLVCGVSFDEGHMWNVVNIDGAHSYVDVTWNDRYEYPSYQYFNITASQLEFDHELSPLHTEIKAEEISKGSFNFVNHSVTYSGNTYYEKYKSTISLASEKKVAKAIEKRFNEGEDYIELLFTSKITLSEFQKSNLEYIASIQKHLKNIKIETYIFERDILTLFFVKK